MSVYDTMAQCIGLKKLECQETIEKLFVYHVDMPRPRSLQQSKLLLRCWERSFPIDKRYYYIPYSTSLSGQIWAISWPEN